MLLGSLVGVLKFVTLFVAPGTGAIISWMIKAVEILNSLKNMVEKIWDSINYFKQVVNNPKLKSILE